ncbi:MAG: hypothetical protein SGJ19_00675 [Planctomycetia bacterium]|nr:hypothetical protein [Planctomycetia bacterium]
MFDATTTDVHLTNGKAVPAEAAPDPFDLDRLRLSQNFGESLGVKKILTTLRCRKPDKQEFVRVRPGDEWRLQTAILEDRINREDYIVDPKLHADVAEFLQPVVLLLATTKQGNPFIWRAKLPSADGRPNAWNDSMLAAAQAAETKWVRVASNMPGGLYDVYTASGDLAEPDWPELSFQQCIKLCFQSRFIAVLDHPVLKQLRGEA